MQNNYKSNAERLGLFEDPTFRRTHDTDELEIVDDYSVKDAVAELVELADTIVADMYQANAEYTPKFSQLAFLKQMAESGNSRTSSDKADKLLLEAVCIDYPQLFDRVLVMTAITKALEGICEAVEIEGAEFETVVGIARNCIEVGRLIARLELRPNRRYIHKGRRQLIDRPAKMRDVKANSARKARIKNRQKGEAALKWAKDKFPTAAADEKTSFLKIKAADHLKIHPSTLNRWLNYRKEKE
jgi:hypothetical protein